MKRLANVKLKPGVYRMHRWPDGSLRSFPRPTEKAHRKHNVERAFRRAMRLANRAVV